MNKNSGREHHQLQMLHNRVNELTQQMEQMEEVIRVQRQQIGNLSTGRGDQQVVTLMEENEIQARKIQYLEKERMSMQEYYEELLNNQQYTQNDDLQKEMIRQQQQFQQCIDSLEMKIQIVLQDNDRLSKCNNPSLQDNNKWQQQNLVLVDQINYLIKDNTRFKEQWDKLNVDLINVIAEKDKHYRDLLQVKSAYYQLKQTMIRVQESIVLKDQEHSEVVNQLSYLQNQLHCQIQSNKEQNRLMGESAQVTEQLSRQCDELTQLIGDNQVDMYKQKCALLERECSGLLNELAQYKQQMDDGILMKCYEQLQQ